METSGNGAGLPVAWQDAPTETIAKMELAYAEIQRRDSQAERRAGRKDTLALRLGLVIVALVGALVWLAIDRHQVKAFVQTVQVNDAGQLVHLGLPQSLYAYTPPDGAYMDMVAQWVRWVRWRGEDLPMLTEQRAWVYRHTCGVAMVWLKALEDKEHLWRIGPRRVGVELRSVTKIPAPESYQVVWEETTTDKHAPTAKVQLWGGALTVGRMKLTRMDDLLDNRLGICVSAYELSPMSPQR
jgi:type IV secretory pathway TrbF-like protein